MERVLSEKYTIEIVTNKQTIREEFDSLLAMRDYILESCGNDLMPSWPGRPAHLDEEA